MSGPKDIATAKSVIAEKTPAGDANHRDVTARTREESPSDAAPAMAAARSARGRLVTLRPGSRIDQPSSSITSTPPTRTHTSAYTLAYGTGHAGSRFDAPSVSDESNGLGACAEAPRHTAIAASRAIVTPGNNKPSAFGHACAIGPQNRRL